ncbi:MAG: hypothetical protein JWN45_2721 [Acidobacteriaceae bacterium]|nr:hypothetical protein [Acidobacteriaceae bacterium]
MSSVENIPEQLRPAVKHIQEEFDSSDFKVSWITHHLCFADLHPANPHRYIGREDEMPQLRTSFAHLKQILGTQTAQIFDQTVSLGTPSAIFHGYAEIYRIGMDTAVRRMFIDAFQIANANPSLLGSNPFQWAKDQVVGRMENIVSLAGSRMSVMSSP